MIFVMVAYCAIYRRLIFCYYIIGSKDRLFCREGEKHEKGNYETFLDATDSVGTFATSNLEKPYGWTLRNGCGQVYQANGFMLIFR